MGLQQALAADNFWRKISISPVIIKRDQHTRNFMSLGEKCIGVILEILKSCPLKSIKPLPILSLSTLWV